MGKLEAPGYFRPAGRLSRNRILFVTPELDDFVRVGGLGAVSPGFSMALMKRGTL
jgi:hypothetical protein